MVVVGALVAFGSSTAVPKSTANICRWIQTVYWGSPLPDGTKLENAGTEVSAWFVHPSSQPVCKVHDVAMPAVQFALPRPSAPLAPGGLKTL